jgi:hypothetical protein
MPIIFFHITMNSSSQAKQSIPRHAVRFYDDRMQTCEDFAQNVDDKELAAALRLTFPFSPANF